MVSPHRRARRAERLTAVRPGAHAPDRPASRRQARTTRRQRSSSWHKLLPVKVEDIAWFKAVDRLVWLYTAEGKKYIVNYTLGDLEGLLDPQRFIRLNRQYLASHGAIAELHPYFKGQVMVRLRPKTDDEIVVSRGQTPVLKAWLER